MLRQLCSIVSSIILINNYLVSSVFAVDKLATIKKCGAFCYVEILSRKRYSTKSFIHTLEAFGLAELLTNHLIFLEKKVVGVSISTLALFF